MLDYDFSTRLFPRVPELISRWKRAGTAAILTDGDVVFQPRKIVCSGLWEAVGGKVFISIHKEQELYGVERRFPAEHYVMVDDKLRLLTAIKKHWGAKVTTVFVRQGHDANNAEAVAHYPDADLTVEGVGELCDYDAKMLIAPAAER